MKKIALERGVTVQANVLPSPTSATSASPLYEAAVFPVRAKKSRTMPKAPGTTASNAMQGASVIQKN
jgi:hypothetical protein